MNQIRRLIQGGTAVGPDGSLRAIVRPGEGEYVCAHCDLVVIAPGRPDRCEACGCDRVETLTALRDAAASDGAHG